MDTWNVGYYITIKNRPEESGYALLLSPNDLIYLMDNGNLYFHREKMLLRFSSYYKELQRHIFTDPVWYKDDRIEVDAALEITNIPNPLYLDLLEAKLDMEAIRNGIHAVLYYQSSQEKKIQDNIKSLEEDFTSIRKEKEDLCCRYV